MNKRKILIGCGISIGLFCLCGGGLWIFFVDFWTTSWGFDAAWARAEKAGVPLTPEQADPRPLPKPSENAADILDKLAQRGGGRMTSRGTFERTDQELASAIEASRRPRLVYTDNGESVFLSSFPKLALVKSLVQGLSNRGEGLMIQDRQAEAERDFGAALRLAHLSQDSGYFVPALASAGMRVLTLSSVRRSAALPSVSAAQVDRLRQTLDQSWKPFDLPRTLKGEIYYFVDFVQRYQSIQEIVAELNADPDSEATPTVPLLPARPGKPKKDFSQAFLVRYFDFWVPLMPLVNRKSFNYKEFKTQVEQQRKKIFNLPTASRVLPDASISTLPIGIEAVLRVEVNFSQTKAALRILARQKRTGKWPQSLAEAQVREKDYYSGQAFRFRPTFDGFEIWSVGPNGIDDQGIKDDIALNYPFPAKKT